MLHTVLCPARARQAAAVTSTCMCAALAADLALVQSNQ